MKATLNLSLIEDFDVNKNCESESKIKELRLQGGGERCTTKTRGELELERVFIIILIIARK